ARGVTPPVTAPDATVPAPPRDPALPPPAETVARDPSGPRPVAAPVPAVPTTAGFEEDTRRLLRRRLLVTHAAIGVVTAVATTLAAAGAAILPAEAGLGRWGLGLPLLALGQSVAGLAFLLRRPAARLADLRFVELTQVGMLAALGGAARFLVLSNPPPASPEPRYPVVLYRLDAVITNLPIVFGVVLYGVLIPNTRRRSLWVAGGLCLVPVLATAAAAAANPAVRPTLPQVVPVTALPLFLAGVVAVVSASRTTALRREAFEARREAGQVGPYTLGRRLGRGGMGDVFLAEHRLLKRPCAVKFIRPELAADASAAARFEHEVRAVTTLTHPNTVRVYDYGRADDGGFYAVMEYLPGPTLDRLVRAAGPLPPGRAVYLVRQLCGALAEAHAAGLVHRDLKPSNVIVTTLGGQHDVAKLLDFGLVCDTRSGAGLTAAGAVLGTPAYMAPEQAGGDRVDARGDLYSLGAVLFFALAGRPPFEGTAVGRIIAAHLTEPAPHLTEVRKDAPQDLAAVVAKCLAKSPADRYQSALGLDAALAGCQCAADWSGCRAAEWWAAAGDLSDPG
ncbi:MAG: serine/threonine protein kinase, partial [Gemmataceae bacterium]|nr:serine/threonine protein kinase [Gemmataceae bacterium]